MPGHVHMDDRRPPQPVFVRHIEMRQTPAQPHAFAHGHPVLAFCTAGIGELEQRGRVHVGAGDVFLVPAGEAHRWLGARHLEAWGLGFDALGLGGGELAGLLAPFERVRDGACPVVAIPGPRQQRLHELMLELRHETAAPGLAAHAVQRSLLTLALAEVARAIGDPPATGAPPLVTRALRIIEQRCLGPLSLRDVAAALDRTPAHLTTAMRRATGRTVQQWICAMRLSEARARLLASDDSIEAIAARVGDLDPSHFIRTFRRAHGHSPAAWRALQRAG